MATPNLIQLAPTLSAEERYKILSPDFMALVNGEQQVLTESERRAMIRFESNAEWRKYALLVITFKMAGSFWPQEMEAERWRMYSFFTHADYTLEEIATGMPNLPKEYREKKYEKLKHSVEVFNVVAARFYAYQGAILRMEEELCGMPFFSVQAREVIAGWYEFTDFMVEFFNENLREYCASAETKRYMKPILRDRESYLMVRPKPSVESVEKLVDAIKGMAESEMRSRE